MNTTNEQPNQETANAQSLNNFTPPHHVVLFNENREAFEALNAELVALYNPLNAIALSIVRDIASARWQINRLDGCLTNAWNLALVAQSEKPLTVAPAIGELEIIDRAAAALHTGQALAKALSRQIDGLHLRIARLERRLRFVHANFPTHVIPAEPPQDKKEEERTQPAPKNEENEPATQPLFVNENTQAVIEYYRKAFPGRPIVVLPPDDVANGVEIADDLPPAPRIAA